VNTAGKVQDKPSRAVSSIELSAFFQSLAPLRFAFLREDEIPPFPKGRLWVPCMVD
jgi:hypothetical protein